LRFALVHAQYVLGMEKTLFGERMQNVYNPGPMQGQMRPDIRMQPMMHQYQEIPQQYQQTQNLQLQNLLKTISPQQLKELLAITPEQLKGLPEQTKQQVMLIQAHAAQLAKHIQ